MIKLTINKKEILAKRGETVLEVAQRQGIYIPTLCYQKGLIPYGGCRMCIVEVKGWSRPVTACTLPVEKGMVVRTNTPKLKKLRKLTLQLILSEHPHACLICDRKEECANYQECIQKTAITFGCKFCPQNGNCELQKLVDYLGVEEIPFAFNYRDLEIERFDPFFDRDYNLCILCGRCVRVCHEIRNADVLDFHHRGPDTLVGTAYNLPHLDTGCQFCGACVDACPTGALRQRYGKWEGQVQRSVKTTCLLCNIGCTIDLNVCDNRIVSSTPNNNQICVRGRFGIAPLVHHPKRITSPLLKKDGRIVEVNWEEALNYAASRLTKHKGKIGILFSPQLTIEAINSIYGFADNLKCNNITAPVVLDKGLKTLNLRQFKANSVFIIVNTDMVSDFSPLLLKLRKKLKNRLKFIVIDVLKSKSAEMADLWFRPKPGKEVGVIELLFTRKKMSNTTGIPSQDIKLGKDLVSGGEVYLLYNPYNIKGIVIPASVQSIPLTSQINTLKIFDKGVDCSIENLLGNKNIDCLYLIGTAPKLNKKYKTVIIQDYFLPPFEFDLFLPAATFAETRGTVTNIEGKIKKLQRAIVPLGKSQSDDWIINEIGKLLKFDLKRRRQKKKKNVRQSTVKKRKVSRKYPFYLMVRENCYSYRGFPLSSFMKGFERLRHDSYVWVGQKTAKKLKLNDNMKIKVSGENLNITMPVMISDVMLDNSVLIYSHPSIGIIEEQPVRITRRDK